MINQVIKRKSIEVGLIVIAVLTYISYLIFRFNPLILIFIGVLLIVAGILYPQNNKSKSRRNRKGQEEITGFVMIVVLVSVILVVFLGIALRGNEPLERESKDVSQFLEAMMEYTTECELTSGLAYVEVDELIKECYENPGKNCVSGNNVCSELNQTAKGILEASWPTGKERAVKGILFKTNYEENSSSGFVQYPVLAIENGNCTSNARGAEHFSANLPGNIVTSLKICS